MRTNKLRRCSGLAARLALSPLSLALFALSCAGNEAAKRTATTEAKVIGGSVVERSTGPSLVSEMEAAVPIAPWDPTWGSRRALVSIVIFGDYQCPYTGRIVKTVQDLEAKYGPGDLRVVWKDEPLPFHPSARPAAEAAEAVFMVGGSDAYWKFWEAALSHQGELNEASFDAWALRAGVDVPSFHRLLAQHAGGAKIDVDMAVARRLKALGTPTAFVNGVAIEGAQPLVKFVEVVDAELAKAKLRLAAGIAPDALYADLARTNLAIPADAPDPKDDKDEEPDDTRTVFKVPLGDAPGRGGAHPLVTIVEFSDFQCPYCKRVEPTLQQIRETYGDRVRVVWKDDPLPFHPHAEPAAELAREARAEKGEAGFWLAHDALFASQPKLADQDLEALGKTLGLDAARVGSALATKRFEASIKKDVELAQSLEARGTPHFFVNGRRLIGAQPFENFKPIIDEEIHHAEDLLAHGAKQAALYDVMMRTAVKASVGEVKHVTPRAGAPFKGPEKALVVIEEFADFQCPYCAHAEPALTEVVKTYGSKVKIVWRNYPLPFHPYAELAAEAAAEAQRQKGNAAFWTMHDKLFARAAVDVGDRSGLDQAALESYAHELGLDMTAFKQALEAHTHRPEIDTDTAAADAAHIAGTPTFVVGGYLVVGAQPFEKFKQVIDEALASGPAKP